LLEEAFAGTPYAEKLIIHEAGDPAWLQSQEAGREVGRVLLILLLLALLAEQFLAYRLSFHPTAGGRTAEGGAR
jgi:hypothetical protein